MKFKYSLFIFWCLILIQNITIGNYTFLKFTPSGNRYNIIINELIILTRFPLVVIPVLFVLFLPRKTRRELNVFLAANWDILLFLLLSFVSISNTPYYIEGYVYTVWFFFSFIAILIYLFIISYQRIDREAIISMSKMLIYGNVMLFVLLLMSLPMYSWQFDVKFDLGFGGFSFFSNSLLVSVLALMVLAIIKRDKIWLLYFRKKHKIPAQYLMWGIFFFMGVIMFFTGRRTPLILYFICLPWIIYLYFGNNRVVRYLLIMALPIAIAIAAVKVPQMIEEYASTSNTLTRLNRMNVKDGGEVEDSSFEERLIVWSSYLEAYERFPIFGGGIGTARHNLYFYGNKLIKSIGLKKTYSPHSAFVGFLVETGAVGFILFTFGYLRSLWLIMFRGSSLVKRLFVLFAIPALLMNLVEFNVYPGQSLFWPTFIIWLFPRIYLNKHLIRTK